MKLVRQVLFQARLNEAAPAIATTNGVATYGTLARIVEAAVAALETLGLERGTPVMLDVRNPLHHTALILALALLGLPSASVASNLATEKTGFMPTLLLSDRDGAAMAGVRVLQIDDRWFAHDPSRPVDYARLLALRGFGSPDEVVRYVYSSGTTGYPKCVALTGAALELRILHAYLTYTRSNHGALLIAMGFSTIAGIMAPLLALPVGMLLCLPGSPGEIVPMIRLFNVTIIGLAVVQLRGLLDVLAHEPPPPSLSLVVVAGAKMPIRLLQEARARLCNNISFGYGSTEMGSMADGNGLSLERYEGSAGFVRPWVEMQAVDAQDRPVPPGTDGILRGRSPEMAFYATETADPTEIIRDGWFYPGDVGRVYEDGLVVITGRTTEVINRGGVIVAPELVEEALRLDPVVKDVAVVGVPIGGIEEIWAAVVSDAPVDAEAIAARAHPRLNEKTPNRILGIDAVPRNENGKVMRAALREALLARVRPT